jgi:hypothetical protein
MLECTLLAQSAAQSRGTLIGLMLAGILIFGVGLAILLLKKNK